MFVEFCRNLSENCRFSIFAVFVQTSFPLFLEPSKTIAGTDFGQLWDLWRV